MSHRNLVWIIAVFLLVLLFWHTPDTVVKQQSVYKVFGPLVGIRARIHKNYVEEVDDDKLLENAIHGMLNGLDPYSRYIPASELESFNQLTQGRLAGIGIYLAVREGILTVISPVENSPAFSAGIMPDDQILTIDDEPTASMSMMAAANRLRGKPGTVVVIEIKHVLTGTMNTYRLRRAEVRIQSVKGFKRGPEGHWDYMIDPNKKIAYMRITNFTDESVIELRDELLKLRSQSMQGLILDVRSNPGGLLNSAANIVDLFVKKGTIVTTRGKWSDTVVRSAHSENTFPPVPMVVLINQYSASASEIVAGALKDLARATLVGVRTFGKGSVQTLYELDDNRGGIKITTQHYYLPSGRNIHRRKGVDVWGVDPHIEITLTTDELVAIQQSRRDADILYGNGENGANGTGRKPVSIVFDKQLIKALEVLRATLPGKPATTTAVRKAG